MNFAFAEDNETLNLSSDENVTFHSTVNESVEKEIHETPKTIQSIKMNGVVNRFKGGVSYSATFYDPSGNPINSESMWFTVDSTSIDWGYDVSTNSKGVAILNVGLTKGTHTIRAYNMFTGENASDTIKVFDILTGTKDITVYYDNGNTFKVRAFDNNGNPVSAQKVTFTVNGKKTTVKTDKNGYAKLKITQKPGYYSVITQYKDFKVANILYVKSVLKSLTHFSGKSLKSHMKVKIKYLGKSKKNKLIKIKFNKKTYKAKTNKKGIATFKLKTPKKVGRYPVTVSYKKDKLSLLFTRSYA